MWYIYTMENYSVIERNKFESTVVRRMNLELLHRVKLLRKRKTNIVHTHTHTHTHTHSMESRKMKPMNLFSGLE